MRYDLCSHAASPASVKRVNRNLSRSVGGSRQRTTFPCLSDAVRKSAQEASPVSQPRRHVRGPPNSSLQLCYQNSASAAAVSARVHSHLADSPAPAQLSSSDRKRIRWIRTGEMWHLMASAINRMHTCNSLPHREPCCGSNGRTQMAATWWAPMGPFDGSGQDVNTHTQMATLWEWLGDGHVDYWFTQINDSQPGPGSVGDLLPQCWHTGQTAPTTQVKKFQEDTFTFFFCLILTSAWLLVFICRLFLCLLICFF